MCMCVDGVSVYVCARVCMDSVAVCVDDVVNVYVCVWTVCRCVCMCVCAPLCVCVCVKSFENWHSGV